MRYCQSSVLGLFPGVNQCTKYCVKPFNSSNDSVSYSPEFLDARDALFHRLEVNLQNQHLFN